MGPPGAATVRTWEADRYELAEVVSGPSRGRCSQGSSPATGLISEGPVVRVIRYI
jgi:hypothetical protein